MQVILVKPFQNSEILNRAVYGQYLEPSFMILRDPSCSKRTLEQTRHDIVIAVAVAA
jgi:hypothetical protein